MQVDYQSKPGFKIWKLSTGEKKRVSELINMLTLVGEDSEHARKTVEMLRTYDNGSVEVRRRAGAESVNEPAKTVAN